MAFLGASALPGGSSALSSVGGTFGFGQNNGNSVFGVTPQAGVVSNSDAYNLNNGAAGNINSQAAFVQALQAQNGIGNQSQVFNQLQGVANGTGPNPAQAQLAQATGQNVSNQAALMAGQRGASQNPALIARQAAMQGANIQQQAAGQAATLQANQSLGALQQMGGLATQQVGQQQGAYNSQYNALQGQQALVNSQNQNAINQNSGINTVNSGLAMQNSKNQAALVGGILNGAGSAMGAGATGGEVRPDGIGNNPVVIQGSEGLQDQQQPQAPGVEAQSTQNVANNQKGPRSFAGKFLSSGASSGVAMSQGGKVPALLSPGELRVPRDQVQAVAAGKVNPLQAGERIPGKAKVAGNSLKNDVVKKDLNPGDVIIPRSVMESDNPMANSIKFVHAAMAKSRMKK